MTNTNLLQAIGRIDPRLIADAAPDVAQKKPANKTWIKWASLAACLCFTIMIAMVGVLSSSISSVAVVNYGAFIFVPVLIMSFIPLCLTFIKKETTFKSSLITSAISLVVVNILNVLGLYLYSQFGGINILGNLTIILVSSNLGSIIPIATNLLLVKKLKKWLIKLLLWLCVYVVSIIVACMAHNIILALFQCDMLMIA